MKKGFTLVELSIVLVIIGILIGGILVAQSIISTTRMNSFLSQIAQADIAISNFQLRYNSFPGDSAITGGNNSGIIEDDGLSAWSAGTPAPYIIHYDNEVPNFWPALSMIGFDPNHKYTATITGTFNSVPGALNAPFAAIGNKASIIPVTWDGDGVYNWYRVSNIQLLTAANTSLYPSTFGGDGTYPDGDSINAIKSIDVQAICTKIGNGNMAEEAGPGTPMPPSKMVFGLNYPNATDCTLSDDKCLLFIRMLAQSGQYAYR